MASLFFFVYIHLPVSLALSFYFPSFLHIRIFIIFFYYYLTFCNFHSFLYSFIFLFLLKIGSFFLHFHFPFSVSFHPHRCCLSTNGNYFRWPLLAHNYFLFHLGTLLQIASFHFPAISLRSFFFLPLNLTFMTPATFLFFFSRCSCHSLSHIPEKIQSEKSVEKITENDL